MEPGTIVQGVKPNQYGTWGYGRAGWCPGQDVHPMVTDITDYVSIGDENVIAKSVELTATNTLTYTEKLLIEDGDSIVAVSANGTVNAVLTYTTV